jgi:colanic acid/amylovoran biosynthesis glycosyltransferase
MMIPAYETKTGMSQAGAGPKAATLKVAYLTSVYPALSHTFILREIDALEARGHTVARLSIRRPAQPQSLGAREQEEMASTTYLLDSMNSMKPGSAPSWATPSPIPRSALAMVGRALRAFRKNPARPLQAAAYLGEALWLAAWMKRNEIRHVHNHFGNAAGTVAWIAAADSKVDFSLSVHGPDIFYEMDASALPQKCADASFSRVISHFCRSQLCLHTEPAHWNRFPIVRCGVKADSFAPRPHPANHRPRILCVGRLVPAKGQHILLEASIRLKRKGLDHELTLVGAGPDQESLQAAIDAHQAGSWITLAGGCPQEEVRAHYLSADLFVLPSFAEGIPVVLMEAMAMEIPVISTPIAGIPELIQHGHSGLLARPASVEDLARQIEKLLNQPELARTCARHGRQTILSHYNLDRNGPQMAALFEQYMTS